VNTEKLEEEVKSLHTEFEDLEKREETNKEKVDQYNTNLSSNIDSLSKKMFNIEKDLNQNIKKLEMKSNILELQKEDLISLKEMYSKVSAIADLIKDSESVELPKNLSNNIEEMQKNSTILFKSFIKEESEVLQEQMKTDKNNLLEMVARNKEEARSLIERVFSQLKDSAIVGLGYHPIQDVGYFYVSNNLQTW